MNPLLAKEVRMLLPVFAAALLLAVVPLWLMPVTYLGNEGTQLARPFYCFCFGALLLALSSFGREFSMGTFPLLLALPLTRGRIWWAKISVLAVAMLVVFVAGCVSLIAWQSTHLTFPIWLDKLHHPGAVAITHAVVIAIITYLVVIASGLWTTLLLRQVVAAFWFAVLIPTAVMTLILWNGGTVLTAEIALIVYSVGGFLWAWRQFYRAQEVAWTGGELSLPEWRSAGARARSAGRGYRPLTGLVLKELRLYQVALAGMAGLFVLHLGVIALRKALQGSPEDSLLRNSLSLFGGLWLIMPFITGGLNVADERRLGTMEAHLCLPVSRRVQFVIKLLVMLLMSGFASAFLLWLAEGIGDAFHASGGLGPIKISLNLAVLAALSIIFISLSLLIFYASTLCRNIFQAVVTAVVLAMGFAILWASAENIRWLTGIWFWQEPLLLIITVPTMIVTVIWLAYANFRRLAETRRLWLRNAGGLAGAMLFAATLTTLLFHRAWEWFTPLESPHGPARLSLSQAPQFRADYASVSAVLPDGRLWWDRIAYDSSQIIPLDKYADYLVVGGKLVGANGGHYLDGSNWVEVADTYWNSVGLRADGTLWHSEDNKPVIWQNNHPHPQPVPRMSRVGEGTDWKQVVPKDGYNFLLLKTDGTLWCWGTNHNMSWPSLAKQKLQQVGTESDWSELFHARAGAFAWKKDGRAWKICWPVRGREKIQTVLEPELALERWPDFDKIKWRSLTGWPPFQLGVRDDGTLWSFGGLDANYVVDNEGLKQSKQIGTGRDWVAVTGDNQLMIALKTDGTLWKWDLENWQWNYRDWPFSKPPTRLGTHSDWIAISGLDAGAWSLAADGSLWYWSLPRGYDSLLGPSRKPVKFANLFSQQ